MRKGNKDKKSKNTGDVLKNMSTEDEKGKAIKGGDGDKKKSGEVHDISKNIDPKSTSNSGEVLKNMSTEKEKGKVVEEEPKKSGEVLKNMSTKVDIVHDEERKRRQDCSIPAKAIIDEMEEVDKFVKRLNFGPRVDNAVALENFGYTCYINVIIQLLYNIPDIRNTFILCQGENHLKTLFMEMNQCKEKGFSPSVFVRNTRLGDEQGDPQEYLTKLLDMVENQLDQGDKDCIKELFNIMIEEKFKCENCGFLQSKKVPLVYLHFHMKKFEDDLENNFRDKVTKLCLSCGPNTSFKVEKRIIHFPMYIAVLFHRFGNGKKITRAFEFPVSLTLNKYVKGTTANRDTAYTIRGVVSHIGEINTGHYISYVDDGKYWRRYNDDKISLTNIQKIRQKTKGKSTKANVECAYLLLYENKGRRISYFKNINAINKLPNMDKFKECEVYTPEVNSMSTEKAKDDVNKEHKNIKTEIVKSYDRKNEHKNMSTELDEIIEEKEKEVDVNRGSKSEHKNMSTKQKQKENVEMEDVEMEDEKMEDESKDDGKNVKKIAKTKVHKIMSTVKNIDEPTKKSKTPTYKDYFASLGWNLDIIKETNKKKAALRKKQIETKLMNVRKNVINDNVTKFEGYFFYKFYYRELLKQQLGNTFVLVADPNAHARNTSKLQKTDNKDKIWQHDFVCYPCEYDDFKDTYDTKGNINRSTFRDIRFICPFCGSIMATKSFTGHYFFYHKRYFRQEFLFWCNFDTSYLYFFNQRMKNLIEKHKRSTKYLRMYYHGLLSVSGHLDISEREDTAKYIKYIKENVPDLPETFDWNEFCKDPTDVLYSGQIKRSTTLGEVIDDEMKEKTQKTDGAIFGESLLQTCFRNEKLIKDFDKLEPRNVCYSSDESEEEEEEAENNEEEKK